MVWSTRHSLTMTSHYESSDGSSTWSEFNKRTHPAKPPWDGTVHGIITRTRARPKE
ncbi:Uncharacterized protein DAT39_020767 [Clarias magur]|uniref:Uncharacterized protein n=1 Tax=Clarias magur TaxID=1594786 RepID=A0A8J4WSV5_CLAMG|nr:Uncharacterized protein DAT39_020767 [Clarias magur]